MLSVSRRHLLKLTTLGGLAATLGPLSALAGWLPSAVTQPGQPLLTLNGDDLPWQQFEGQVVLLNFWATWCPPCVEELPDLVRIQRSLGRRNLQVVAANLGESPAKIRQFLAQLKLSETDLLFALDNAGILAKQWNVNMVPTTFLIDQKGQPLKLWKGEVTRDHDAFMNAVESVLP
jgi:thiol-disulfide isomerase/thioredoxin